MPHSPNPLVYLGAERSPFALELRALVEKQARAFHADRLDAPWTGRVTVAPPRVLWNGFDLTQAAAIVIDEVQFPWPQPQLTALLEDGSGTQDAGVLEREAIRDREGRSLLVGALAAAAECCPVYPSPRVAHAAVAPGWLLQAVAAAGLPVVPWSLTPRSEASPDAVIRDVAGPDAWYTPGEPALDQACLALEPECSTLVTVLWLGREPLGACEIEPPRLGQPPEGEVLPSGKIPSMLTEGTGRVVEALGLDVAAVTWDPVQPRVAWIDAAPRLSRWNELLPGRVGPRLLEALLKPLKKGVHA